MNAIDEARRKVLSVIIVTYFSDEFIDECLTSLFLHNDLDEAVEVIVVDNSPHTTDYLKGAVKRFFNVKLMSNPINGGFGQANNIGADASCGEILLFLNPDTKFVEPVFGATVELFDRNSDTGAIGCKLVDGKGNPTYSYGYFPEKWNLFLSAADKFFFRPLGYVPHENIYPWGADLFVRKADFYAAGKFDERFFLCHEEPDLCRRLLPKKALVIDKKIVHHGEHSTGNSTKKQDAWFDSLALYHQKYGFDLYKTLWQYRVFFLLVLVRRVLLGRDCRDIKYQLMKIKLLIDGKTAARNIK